MKILNAKDSKPLEGGASFPLRNRLFRLLWNIVWAALGSWTPPPLHKWRVFLLRCFGADIHPTARVYGGVRVWYPPNLTLKAYALIGPGVNCYSMAHITIGERAVISQGAFLCCGSHDITSPSFQLIAKPIVVGDNSWVAAEAFIGPGVTIGSGTVIGARGVLFSNAASWSVLIGNPAVPIKQRVWVKE